MDNPAPGGTIVPDSGASATNAVAELDTQRSHRSHKMTLPVTEDIGSPNLDEANVIFQTPRIDQMAPGKDVRVEEAWTLRSCDSGFSQGTIGSAYTDFSTRSSPIGSCILSSPESEISDSKQRRVTLAACEFSPVNRDGLGAPKGRKLRFGAVDAHTLTFEETDIDRSPLRKADSFSEESGYPISDDVCDDTDTDIHQELLGQKESMNVSSLKGNFSSSPVRSGDRSPISDDLQSSLQEMSLEESSSSSSPSPRSNSPPFNSMSPSHALATSGKNKEVEASKQVVTGQDRTVRGLEVHRKPEGSLGSIKCQHYLHSLSSFPTNNIAKMTLKEDNRTSFETYPCPTPNSTSPFPVSPGSFISSSSHHSPHPTLRFDSPCDPSELCSDHTRCLHQSTDSTDNIPPPCPHYSKSPSKRFNNGCACHYHIFSPTKALKTEQFQNIHTEGTVHFWGDPSENNSRIVRKILVDDFDSEPHRPPLVTEGKASQPHTTLPSSSQSKQLPPRRVRRQRSLRFERSPQFISLSHQNTDDDEANFEAFSTSEEDVRSPLERDMKRSESKFNFSALKSKPFSRDTKHIKDALRGDASNSTAMHIPQVEHYQHGLSRSSSNVCNPSNYSAFRNSVPYQDNPRIASFEAVAPSFKMNTKPVIPHPPTSLAKFQHLRQVIQKFSPTEPTRLIGRHIGVRKFDILGNLQAQGFSICLGVVFQYLTTDDLISVRKVSREWWRALFENKLAYQRYCQHLARVTTQRRVARVLDKENLKSKPAEFNGTEPLTTSRGRLTNIQLQATVRDVHREASISPKKNQDQQSSYLSGDQLRPCPHCQSPALIRPGQDRATCTQYTNCGYDFCLKCFAPFHKSRPCKPLLRQISTAYAAGTHKSKKSLKRL